MAGGIRRQMCHPDRCGIAAWAVAFSSLCGRSRCSSEISRSACLEVRLADSDKLAEILHFVLPIPPDGTKFSCLVLLCVCWFNPVLLENHLPSVASVQL